MDQLSIAVHLSKKFEANLLQTAAIVVPVVIEKLRKGKFYQLEVLMNLFQRLQPEFHFKHADEFVAIFETLTDAVNQPNGVLLRWSNPLMVMVLSLDVLYKLKDQFRSLALRANAVCDKMRKTFIKIYENYYEPEKVEILLSQKDVDGKTVLQYISDLKFYEFLQINHVNRIVNGQWNSKADVGGSLFEMSTSYDLCCRNKLRFKEDRE